MRPEAHRTRARAAAVARGRMYLKARLDWLAGFPVAQANGVVTWCTLPRQGEQPPTLLPLDRDALHRATRTWSNLVHNFPRALPQIVDDYERWVTGVPQLLAWLKPAIHGQETLPVTLFAEAGAYPRAVVHQATQLGNSFPPLQPVLNALSWWGYLTPQEMPAALAWLESNVTALLVILARQPTTPAPDQPIGDPIVTVLTLWNLARRDGVARVAPLIAWLGDRRLDQLAMTRVDIYIMQWVATLQQACHFNQLAQLPPPPVAAAGALLYAYLPLLARQRREQRRRALDLMGLLLAPQLLEAWAAWWAMVEPLFVRARRVVAVSQAQRHKQDHAIYVEELNALREQCQASHALLPPGYHWSALVQGIQHFTADEQKTLYAAMLPALAALPPVLDERPIRHHFLQRWLQLSLKYPLGLAEYLTQFQLFLSRHRALPNLLDPWANGWVIMHHEAWRTHWDIDHIFLHELPDRKRWSHLFAALATVRAAYPGALTDERAEWVVKLAARLPALTLVESYFAAINHTALIHDGVDDELLDCLLLLVGTPTDLGALIVILQQARQNDWPILAPISTLATYLRETAWNDLTRTLLLNGEVATVAKLGRQLTMLTALQGQVPVPPALPPTTLPAWAARYPAPLHQPLCALAAIDPQAEQTAERLLGDALPNPLALEREIAAIVARLDADPQAQPAHLEQRLANLRQRLATPTPLTPARLAKLLTKVARATQRTQIGQWQAALAAAIHAQLVHWLDLDPLPAWLLEPRQIELVAALLPLAAPTRALGIRLLRQRSGPPPWHLAAEPANQHYLDRLRRRGIDPTLWVNPAPSQPYHGQNGRQVWLGIETDPLEIFQMGAYFRTCLSPDNFNFFSVFANTADVNKQVVYARDAQGNVVGRCLLALTDSGELLTFEPYCHDPALDFAALMSEFAGTLAQQMGTHITNQGPVRCLVATDWYDDGPRDLCGKFGFLQYQSAFRDGLATINLADFVPTLLDLFAPLPLNTLTLPQVLYLPEVQHRPELVMPLLPYIGNGKGFDDRLLLYVATLARQTGGDEFAHHIVRQRAQPYLLALYRQAQHTQRHEPFIPPYLELLIDLDPQGALRVLRQTRPKGVQQDEDERDSMRIDYLAKAHQALGRPVRSERLRAHLAS